MAWPTEITYFVSGQFGGVEFRTRGTKERDHAGLSIKWAEQRAPSLYIRVTDDLPAEDRRALVRRLREFADHIEARTSG